MSRATNQRRVPAWRNIHRQERRDQHEAGSMSTGHHERPHGQTAKPVCIPMRTGVRWRPRIRVVAQAMAGPHQGGITQSGRQVRGCLVNTGTSVPVKTIVAALFPVCAAGVAAQDSKPIHYTCADGTTLQAIFSPPSLSSGTIKLIFAGSSTQMTLPQAVSADGGRYTDGDVEFWIKGQEATLTRAGASTACRTRD